MNCTLQLLRPPIRSRRHRLLSQPAPAATPELRFFQSVHGYMFVLTYIHMYLYQYSTCADKYGYIVLRYVVLCHIKLFLATLC